MKKRNLILIVFVLMISIFTSCSSSKPVRADTPDNVSMSLALAISGNNYYNFNGLFSDGRKNAVSKETLKEFSNTTSSAFGNSLYGLITFSNGEMFLARYTPKKVDGEYRVEDVVKVPEEMRKLFQVK